MHLSRFSFIAKIIHDQVIKVLWRKGTCQLWSIGIWFILFLARLYEVQGELLQSPRWSASVSAFPSHCDKSFISKFSKSSYLNSHSSESIHIWTIGTLEGRLSFHDSWPQGWCPGMGLEVKLWDTFKKCFSTFLLWKQLRQIVCRTSVSLVTLTYGSGSEGHHDLYFTVQWFCLISWRPFDIWTLYFGIMSQYDPMFDLKINIGQCDLYFMVQWFCLISWRLFDISTPYFGIMSQYDLMFDLKINVGQCDLYFMVQWFCLISRRLFDIWTPYFGIMSQYDLMFDLKINEGHCDLYFIVHWFCLLSLYLMDECHTFGKWVSVIRSSDLSFFVIFALENILVLLAKHNSGELCCPATVLIKICLCKQAINL